ncbi:MAG TPA: GntR family transcriptional regulator [Candidatus Phocaeicola gallistercoris]|nr:GntR family transcriptional regulator [Candidatus Phocaeicola gallistercoris]
MGHIRLGRYNQLEIVKEVDFGVYLDGDEDGEILLPKRYVPQGCQVGDILNVFIYLDMEERLVATTIEPYAQVGDFAYLQVAWVNQYGAFLDWGLMKDLFVPFREQKEKMVKGKSYLVYIYIDDESFRIMASAKIEHFLSDEFPEYQNDECVDILVWKRTDLGFKVIVDNQYSGLIYKSDIFQPISVGMSLKAYIKQVREDGKIDLTLQKSGMEKVANFSQDLYQYVKMNQGFVSMNDKTDAELIYKTFGVSKKTFKKAVGDLYKKRLIKIEPNGLRLLDNGDEE